MVIDDNKTHQLGDRLLYLRTPNFKGEDVERLQTALLALGFACGGVTGVFDAYTEGALRKFQVNMGLEADGIAGVDTYAPIKRLHNAWMDKALLEAGSSYMGFARAADVLEHHAICLFGTEEFTRRVASYMSNLALATNPLSKMMSADSLLVAPDASMLLAHIVLPDDETDSAVPRVLCDDSSALAKRLSAAIDAARQSVAPGHPVRICVEVQPPSSDEGALEADRLAHHDAINLLDSFCMAFS